MAQTYEILGQLSPTANTLTNVFVTGASSSAIVGTITLHNFSDANASYSLVVRPINEVLANKHFIIRGGILPAREMITGFAIIKLVIAAVKRNHVLQLIFSSLCSPFSSSHQSLSLHEY